MKDQRHGRNRHEARSNKHAEPEPRIRVYEEGDFESVLKGLPDPLVLILDNVQDPHNLGACLRTADAAGCALVVMTRDKSAPINDTVRRVACGGADKVPIARVTNLARAMDKLKSLGVWMVGTADEAQNSIYDQDLRGPVALVMGSEGEGMRRLTAEKCDHLVNIPLGGTVPCLNLSVATGVCLFEAVRQRQG